MFGMRGLYSIVLGAGASTDDSAMMQQQMGMGAQVRTGHILYLVGQGGLLLHNYIASP